MATLVLSTVGTLVGGPIGGAIGSLIGQSIDQQLFAPPARRGPRLNDLAVQSSAYGTAIPKLYGTMRVAGSVVWATDLQESSNRQSGGKGQPDLVTYAYSVSLAVALSSRKARAVRRIWADGRLIRGASGDLKIRTQFRFHPGGEDQPVDPLIASAEGLESTPAYRGLALAVFENLELGEFGNRIPFLTFEVEADEAATPLSTILHDVSDGLIDCSDSRTVRGYAAYGSSISTAVEPLVDRLGVDLHDRGATLATPLPVPSQVQRRDLGCSQDSSRVSLIERSREPQQSVPRAISIGYYDPDRDYQAGQMRSSTGISPGVTLESDLPVVLTAAEAKTVSENALARRWARREKLIVRLPPRALGLQPGTTLAIEDVPGWWQVAKVEVEGLVVTAELRPNSSVAPQVLGDGGRATNSPDLVAGPTMLALFDLPAMGASQGGTMLHLAVASKNTTWRRVQLEIGIADVLTSALAASETVMGTTETALGDGQSRLLDLRSELIVELANGEQWLESRDDDALVAGANLAAVGQELIQFGEAVPIGAKRFRLSRLVRGRFGTEWAMAGHSAGEAFALLTPQSLLPIDLSGAPVGSLVTVRALGLADGAGAVTSTIAEGEALRPPSPVHVLAATDANGDLTISWIRRSREGWTWADEIEAPLGEGREQYRLVLTGSGGTFETETASPTAVVSAAELAAVGSGIASLTVVQVGDRAVSRPATLFISLP